jgi:hypothetical protein
LVNIIKQSTQPRREKGGQRERERNQVRAKSTQTQRESQRGKGPKPPHKSQETYQMKLENATNLGEPSLGMMMGLIHAKTIACTFLWKVMKFFNMYMMILKHTNK